MELPIINITYFKSTGKFYTSATMQWDGAMVESAGPYMPDVVAKIRGLRDHGGQGALPGVGGDGWDGPILIDNGFFPHLLMPRIAGGQVIENF